MLKISEHRKQSFRTSWRYHRQEFLVVIAAIVIYFFIAKDFNAGLPKSIIFNVATIFPFVVIMRIIHSGFTGRFNEKYKQGDTDVK